MTSIGAAVAMWRARYDCFAFPVAVKAHKGMDGICPAQKEKRPAYEHAHIGDAHKERG